MDKHINERKALREELNSITEDFRNCINQHYLVAARAKAINGGNHVVKELTLNIEDKFKCIKLGDLLNISQRGGNVSIKVKWGLLPIGMSVDNWGEKFSLSKKKKMDPARAIMKGRLLLKRKTEEVRTAKKQQKVILEDSLEDDGDDVVHPTSKDDAHNRNMEGNDHDDGSKVRVRVAKDASGNQHCSSVDGEGSTMLISKINVSLELTPRS
jgi:hypothetical protein